MDQVQFDNCIKMIDFIKNKLDHFGISTVEEDGFGIRYECVTTPDINNARYSFKILMLFPPIDRANNILNYTFTKIVPRKYWFSKKIRFTLQDIYNCCDDNQRKQIVELSKELEHSLCAFYDKTIKDMDFIRSLNIINQIE